jgi:hypothetical protein
VISVNEWLQDEAIRKAVNFDHYSNNVVNRMLAIVNKMDARLFAELTLALERMDATSFTVQRLESLLSSVRAINADAFNQMGEAFRGELKDFAQYEASYHAQLLIGVMPVTVHVATVDIGQIYTAALSRPFQGMLLKDALKDIELGKAKKIREAIALGFAENKSTSQIIREIRGTRARGYADGLMTASRANIATITRTALSHMAGFVQDRTTEANASLIKAVVWSSTLDLRTSSPCRLRDGLQYHPVTHKPIGHSLPWGQGPGRYHWQCRSAQVYALKSNKELGIPFPDFTMPDGTRASMDGQIPKGVKYGDWLAKQSAARQDEVLGPTRGKLMRDGKLPMAAMSDQRGRFLTLEQLRDRDAGAFKRAGL